jgi:hypothetical protein
MEGAEVLNLVGLRVEFCCIFFLFKNDSFSRQFLLLLLRAARPLFCT